MENRISIGLDISTSIIGVSIFKDSTFLCFKHIDLRKFKCYFHKADIVRSSFISIKDEIEIYTKNVEIFVEESLQSFRRGLSSAKTLMQLSRFNGVVSQIAYEVFQAKPCYINVNTARRTLGIKIDKKLTADTKEQVLEWVDKDMGKSYKWPDKVITRGKNKNSVKLEKYCYDMADAYVICKAVLIDESIKHWKNRVS